MSDPVVDTQFTTGTVITADWLNGVNDFVNTDGATKVYADNAATVAATAVRTDLANTADASKGDALIGVKQPFTGATARTAHSKFTESVSVKDFGAVGDGVADDTAAIQAALTAAAAAGITLYIPAGTYVVTSAISVNTTTGGAIPAGGRRLSIRGDGKSNTVLLYTGASNIKILEVTGNFNDYFLCEDFRIQRPDQASEFGIGLTINNMINFTLRGMHFFRLDTGITMTDVNSVLIDDVSAGYNRLAVKAQFGSVSVPNAITFSNCSFNSNIERAIELIGGVTNVFLNCRIEGNGITDAGSVTPGASAIFILTNNPVNTNFSTAFTMLDCYFEGNAGSADVYAQFNGASAVNITGTLFNRIDSVKYVTNDIVFDAGILSGDANPVAIEMSANSFVSAGSYVPSAGNRAINYLRGASYTGFKINDNNIYQNGIETPLIDPSKDTLRGDPVKVLAMGSANGAGTLSSNYGVTSVVKNGTGDYTINTKNGAANIFGSFSHISSGANAGLIAQVNSRTVNSIRVRWMNPGLGAQDPVAFDFVLFAGF